MKWIDDMTVGRKLALGFGMVLAAIAVMGAVVIMNLMALESAGSSTVAGPAWPLPPAACCPVCSPPVVSPR